ISELTDGDSLRSFEYGTSAHTYSRTGRYLVTVRACAPLSRDGFFGCSPSTPEFRVSTFVPAAPVDLRLLAGVALGVPTSPSITVTWGYADPLAVHDTRTVVVRVRQALAGRSSTITRTAPGPASATVIDRLQTGMDYFVSVSECNDGGRCSASTPELRSQASAAA